MNRRRVLAGLTAAAAGCVRPADWCDTPERTDDGPFPYPDACPVTADDIEGPYYRDGAPERSDLDQWGDDGTPLTLDGVVFDGTCDLPVAGAVVEFWHADPKGRYDNRSDEMRYRARVTTDEQGRYRLKTLLPGRYRNGDAFRPRHVHVKVLGPDGVQRLTTQLYFEGDPYIDCDTFVNTSLVLPTSGDEDTALAASDVWLVLA